MQVFSLRPETMESMYRGWLATMCSGGVPRHVKELVALVVSAAGKCWYCTDSHLIFLLASGVERTKAFDVERSLAEADSLDSAERATLRFAARLTTDPRAVTDDDVLEFAAAWPDADSRNQIVAVISGQNFIYRIASGLGVQLEIPSALRRFDTGRRGAITFLARLTALSTELGERPLAARTPEENRHAFEHLFMSQLGFSGLPPGYRSLEDCPEIFDAQLRVIEKSVAVVPRDRWMRVGLVVSRLTGCDYLSQHCGDWLGARGVDASDVIAASEGAGSSLPESEECCLRFTRDLTLHSHTIGEERIAELRKKGLSDGAILDLTYVGAVFNATARYMRVLAVLERVESGGAGPDDDDAEDEQVALEEKVSA